MSADWIIANGLPDLTMKHPWVVIQYCDAADLDTAFALRAAFGWPLLNTCTTDEISDYKGWVVVGGQFANPVFVVVFGSSVSEADSGFVRIQFDQGYTSHMVWGVAGWLASDTYESGRYIVQNGLPESDVRIGGRRLGAFRRNPRSYCETNVDDAWCEPESYQAEAAHVNANGCGPQNQPDFVPDFNFQEICDQHDRDYARGGTEADRLIADVRLYEGIREAGHPNSGLDLLAGSKGGR